MYALNNNMLVISERNIFSFAWKLILISLPLLQSCIKEIDLKKDYLPPKLAINSLFCPDSIFRIHVSSNAYADATVNNTFSQSLKTNVNDAVVKIFENNVQLELASFVGNGWYEILHYPSIGLNYSIKVTASGYDDVYAESKIPDKTQITKFTCKLLEGYDFDSGSRNSVVNIEFIDFPINKNFFEFSFFNLLNGGNQKRYEQLTGVRLNTSDLSLKTDGDLSFEPQQYYCTDVLFDGELKKLELSNFGDALADPFGGQEVSIPFFLHFLNVSNEYYNFRKSWTKHFYNQNTALHGEDPITLLFLGDPVEMFTNVNGGFGIFAGYSQHIVEVTYIE
jgi:Domain of unknown function (DUF4249)